MATLKYRKTILGNYTYYEIELSGSRTEWAKQPKGCILQFLDTMKQFVPASHRVYDPTTKQWEIDANYWLAIEMACKALNIGMIDLDKFSTRFPKYNQKVEVPKDFEENFFYEEPAAISNSQNTISVSEQLSKILGVDVSTKSSQELKSIYRKKALELHPDRNNGDGTRMSELNSLWSVFSK